MIVKPMIRNNICINCHPEGCMAYARGWIAQAKGLMPESGRAPGGAELPKLALVVGCSSGYGLASRIAAAFGCRAATVGVSFEKTPEKKAGTLGYYNNLAFETEAEKSGLVALTVNADAFSDEAKAKTAEAIREAARRAGIPAKVDLFVYSLASPVRVDPKTGVMHKSAIKPIGGAFSGRTLAMDGSFGHAEAQPASEDEIAATIKVMGGEDWELWHEALDREGLLAPDARALAYTYIGPEHSWPIYKNGTIGRAKEDLERACRAINAKSAASGNSARAWVSVQKALVTRASAVIPVIPLYVSCLFKAMKEKGLHEGCMEQIARLFRERLYAEGSADPASVPVDEAGRIRLDDWEMREDVQALTREKMEAACEGNVFEVTDVEGFRRDFMQAHGFEVEGVDYENAD